MTERPAAFVLVLLLSIVGVAADALLKQASSKDSPFRSPWFFAGLALYGSTAVGWVIVLGHLKLATVGVLYGVFTLLSLAVVGVVLFKEPLGLREMLGLAAAVVSVVLLARYG